MPALVATGSAFHQWGTTDKKSLDCLERAGGRARRSSLEEHSGRDVAYAFKRAFR